MICLVAATFECEVEGGPLIPGIVSMAVKGNSNNTWSIQSGEGTVQKEVFQEGEEIRRGGGRSAWPGRSVSTTKDHLNHSIISIISPACCEMTVLSMALMVLQEKSAEQGWDSFSVVVSDDLQMYIKTCSSCHL